MSGIQISQMSWQRLLRPVDSKVEDDDQNTWQVAFYSDTTNTSAKILYSRYFFEKIIAYFKAYENADYLMIEICWP